MSAGTERSRAGHAVDGNARWLLLGNASYAAGLWLQLAILARGGGPAAVGTYAYALALTAPIMMFATLQLRMLQASDLTRTYTFREYRVLRAATTVAAIAVIAVLAAAGLGGAGSVLVPVCAMRAADAFADVYQGLWQQHERMKPIGLTLLLSSIGSAAAMAIAVALGGGVAVAATGAAMGSWAALLYLHGRTARDASLRTSLTARDPPVSWRRVGRLAVEAAPLGIILLIVSLQHNVPRYFIRQLPGGESALGLFAAAFQLTACGGIVIAALGSAATPRFAALAAGGHRRSFRALAYRLALVGAGLGLGGLAVSALVGREVLRFAYGPDFAAGVGMLLVLSAAAGMTWVASLLGYALTATRVIALQPVLLALTLLVTLAACAALVPRHGGTGAAWAIMLAATLHAVGSAVLLERRHNAAAASPVPMSVGEAP